MTWDITYGGNTVRLPITGQPYKVTKRGPAFLKEIGLPGDALILSFGNKAIIMVWSGILAEDGKDNDQLYTDYFDGATKLEGFKHQEVTIGGTTPVMFQGAWILQDVYFDVRKGVVSALWYRLTFMQGGTHTVF